MDAQKRISVKFETDKDGYISRECPKCEKRFKVKPGEGSDKPISFCPYCKHEGQNCWWTKEQVDYTKANIMKECLEPEFKQMAKKLNRSSRKNSYVTFDMDIKTSPKPNTPQEPENDWPIIFFECCSEKAKHNQSQKTLFCIICGKQKKYASD